MTDQPIILIDMDGVVAGYDDLLFEQFDVHGLTLDIAGAHEQTHRYATDHVVDKQERKLARDITNSAGWFDALPVIDGAVDGLNAISEVAETWLVTKPAIDNPFCRTEKYSWVLRELGKDWARRLMIVPDKSLVLGHVLLDDAPKVDWLDRAAWEPVIFTTPFNGAGSPWADYPHWTWGEPYGTLYHPLSVLDEEEMPGITSKSA